MNTTLREIKHGAKSLLRDKTFALTVFFTLAICIGANAATFAIVNSVLLRPLPVSDADAILVMANQYPKAGVGDMNQSSAGDYYDRLRQVTAFEEQAMFDLFSPTVEIDGTPERITGMTATPSFFKLVKAKPVMGRLFSEEEGERGAEQKVILSHGLWQMLYGGDSSVLGRELRLSGRPFTIVGVMPRGFTFIDSEVRLWTPLAFTAEQKTGYHSNNWYNIGRLRAGATLAQAQAQVDALNAANLERFPQWREILINVGFHTKVERLQDIVVKDVKGILYLLWGGALFVLLIGGLNIANLVLVRLTLRRKEFGTRLALGASVGQITRQFLVENLLLTMAGGIAGIALGAALLRGLATVGLERLPRAYEIQLDAQMVLVGMAMAVAVGAAIGCMPITQAYKVDLNRVLHEDMRTGTGGKAARRMRRSLVIAQVGFAFVLLVGASLLLASFQRLLAVDPGFRTDGVVTASTSLPRARYAEEAQLRAFVDRARMAIGQIPGVVEAGATDSIPFDTDYSDSVILAEGYVTKQGESLISPRQVTVSPGYFEAMGIAFVRGRAFDSRDQETSLPAIIVDERLAGRFWPDQDPIGRRMYRPESANDVFKTDEKTRWLTVVGVVRSIRLENLEGKGNDAGTYYFPYAQSPERGLTFVVRTSADASVTAGSVREVIHKLDPELALFDVRTMAERRELSLSSRRTALTLAAGFGGLAMFLAALGIYSVLAYHMTQRQREFGIRLALGSTRTGIVRLVLREGLLLVGIGLVAGMVGATAIQGIIENEVYGVRPMDPMVIGGVTVLQVLVALAASVFPARRAMRVDPMVALRYE